MFSDLVGKGLPLFTEKGSIIRRELERFIVDEEIKRGYKHVYTPDLANIELYKTSGHYPYYKDTMYPLMKVDENELMLRPMTCPHHYELYASRPRSYRELPFRIAEMAKQFRSDPIYIKSLQISASHGQEMLYEDDWTHVETTSHAAQRAYQEAGVKNPREEISMAEVHDCFSITEAITMEDLQFSPRGKVREDIEGGFFELNGGLPVQPDGGLKSFGHPVGASGLRMVYEMYKQLQSKAESRQIEEPKLGLTHNLGGIPSVNVASVFIVGH